MGKKGSGMEILFLKINANTGAGEMAKQLKQLYFIAEDLRLISGTQILDRFNSVSFPLTSTHKPPPPLSNTHTHTPNLKKNYNNNRTSMVWLERC